MLLADTGGSQLNLVLNEGADLAVVITQPLCAGWSPLSKDLASYCGEFIDRLNGVYVVHPEQVEEGKRPRVADMRKGWERTLNHIACFGPNVRRVLLMCDTAMLRVAVPGLGKHGDIGDCHGTIFTLDNGIELVPTWEPEQLRHTEQWRDRDKQRFLKLTKPREPLPYMTTLPGAALSAKTLVVDIETTGLDQSRDTITALGFQWSATERAVITSNITETLHMVTRHGRNKNVVGHNLQFDLGFMGAPFRESVLGRVRDTIVRARSRGELVAGLKHLASVYTASPGNYAWVGGEAHSFDDPRYLCEDLDTTWRLYHLWEKDNDKLVVQLFDEAVVMAADQTAKGTFVDLEFLSRLADETATDVQVRRAELTVKYGVDPNQQQELTKVLRERGYPLSKKTKSGEDSLTAEVLEELGLLDVLEYRKAMKLDSAFVSKMRGFVRGDGTIPHYQTMLGAKTGRTTMRDFNWQQLPKKGPGKKLVRSRWKGGKIINCDLKQAEVRIACWASGDEVLARALLGPDMHRANAARGFDKSFDEVSDDERFQSKALIFRSIFGGGPTNPQQERVHKYMVGEFRKLFQWIERQKKIGQLEYKVTDLLGKVTNMLDKLDYRGKWACGRLGINAPVQGTSSHVAIWLTLRVWKLFRELGMKSLVLFGVHDSFVVDAHPDEVQSLVAVIAQAFRDLGKSFFKDLFPLMDSLPMGGDVQVGDTWAACKDAPNIVVSSLSEDTACEF